MPGSIQLNVPLKPYLVKYLQKKYGNSHCVSRKSWLGNYFTEIADKKYRGKTVNFKDQSLYQLNIPPSVIKNNGFDVSAQKLKALEVMIEKVFRNDLYSYIDISIFSELKFINETQKSLNKQNAIKAIEQQLYFYGITEDELSIDSVYRDYYRNKINDED